MLDGLLFARASGINDGYRRVGMFHLWAHYKPPMEEAGVMCIEKVKRGTPIWQHVPRETFTLL